jgi:PilZ domain
MSGPDPAHRPQDSAAGFTLAGAGTRLLKKIVNDGKPSDHRRDTPRQQVAGEVVLIVMAEGGEHKQSHRVFIRDLSRGGCGLWSRVAVPGGTPVVVVFNGPDGKPVHKLSRICHCRGQERTGFALGIRFDREQGENAKAG